VRVSSFVSIGPAVWPAIRNKQTDKQTYRLLLYRYMLPCFMSHAAPTYINVVESPIVRNYWFRYRSITASVAAVVVAAGATEA